MIAAASIVRSVLVWAALAAINVQPLWVADCGCRSAEGQASRASCCGKTGKVCCCAKLAGQKKSCCAASSNAAAQKTSMQRCTCGGINRGDEQQTPERVRAAGQTDIVSLPIAIADRAAIGSTIAATAHATDNGAFSASERCALLCTQQC